MPQTTKSRGKNVYFFLYVFHLKLFGCFSLSLSFFLCSGQFLWCYLQLPSHVWLFMIPWTAACQASMSLTISQNLPKLMSSESVMPSNHLILCWPLLFLPSFSPSIRVFSNESALYIAFIYLFYKWYLQLITLHLYSLVVQLVKNPPAMRELDLIPGLGRSPWEGNGYPLQYSCLENLMDRGAW